MGFDKAKSRNEKETVAWQKKEREYLTELCWEQGIEIDVLGISRDNLTLSEYKVAMRKVESLEEQADKIKENNMEQSHENRQLKIEARKLNTDVEQLEERAVELTGQIELLETKEKAQQERIDKYGVRTDGIDKISKEVSAEVKNVHPLNLYSAVRSMSRSRSPNGAGSWRHLRKHLQETSCLINMKRRSQSFKRQWTI